MTDKKTHVITEVFWRALEEVSSQRNTSPIGRNCTKGQREDYPSLPEGAFLQIPFPFEKHVPALEVGLKTAFYIPSILLALVGNCLVLVVIAKSRRMHTATYCYIANLAVSDLLVGGFNTWVHLGATVSANWPFGSVICNISIFFRTLAVVASALFLTVIAVERFCSIVYPLKVRLTKAYVHTIVSLVCWCVACGVALPTAFTRELRVIHWRDYTQKYCAEVWPRYISRQDPDHPAYCLYYYPHREIYYILQVSIMYIVPVVTMAICYILIYYTMHKRRAPGVQTPGLVALVHRTKRKVLRMLVIVFGVFVICYSPQEILTLYGVAVRSASQVPSWVQFLTIYLVYLNSALNPILYGGLNETFRKGLKEMATCKCSNKVSPSDEQIQSPVHTVQTKKLVPRPNVETHIPISEAQPQQAQIVGSQSHPHNSANPVTLSDRQDVAANGQDGQASRVSGANEDIENVDFI